MTDETKHTPGPWLNDGRGTLRGKGGRPVVVKGMTAAMLTTGGDHLEEEANAAVMMAGADLLAALRDAPDMAAFWSGDELRPTFDRTGYTIAYSRWTAVRDAAIAKAEGRS